jgi:hypothetical protein
MLLETCHGVMGQVLYKGCQLLMSQNLIILFPFWPNGLGGIWLASLVVDTWAG